MLVGNISGVGDGNAATVATSVTGIVSVGSGVFVGIRVGNGAFVAVAGGATVGISTVGISANEVGSGLLHPMAQSMMIRLAARII